MTCRTIAFALAIAFLLLVPIASGQIYVVDFDPNPHDFDDLQVALDTVPDGAVLYTPSWFANTDPATGEHVPFFVTKSVTINGSPPPPFGDSEIATTVVIDAPGADVVLTGLSLGYYDNGCLTGDAVEIRAARSVVISNCLVKGGTRDDGSAGAGVRGTGPVDFVGIYNCQVVGAYAAGTVTVYEGGTWLPPLLGGAGVELPDDLVGLALVDESDIEGGYGGGLEYIDDPALDLGPPGPLVGGQGGAAMVGACEYFGCVFRGGPGASVSCFLDGSWDSDGDYDDCLDAHPDICGITGATGPTVDGTAVERLRGTVRVDIARGWSSTVSAYTAPSTLVLFLAAFDPVDALPLRGFDGELQVLPPWIVIPTVSGGGTGLVYTAITGDLPDDPALDGMRLFVQVVDGKALSMLGVGVVGA